MALHITIWLRLADLGSELAWVFSDVLQRTEPLQKVLVVLPGWNRSDRRRIADSLKRDSFHLEIGRRIDLSCFDIHMAQEVADHLRGDSTLQQVHSFGVAKHVRSHRSVQTRTLASCFPDMFLKDVADSRTG